VKIITLVSAIILPFFNIPLIVKIVKRRSAHDISLSWLWGVWVCTVLMAPSGLSSVDPVWHYYTIINLITFTGVVIAVWRYR